MNVFLLRAGELEAELIENRRYFHENAEYGLELPKTKAFLLKKLNEYGYSSPKEVGEGIVCTVGTGTPVFLLRADMDALKQEEKSGLPFACVRALAIPAVTMLIPLCCSAPLSC